MNVDFHLKIFSVDRRVSISMKWIQYAIILAVVLVSVAAAYWGSRTIMIALIVAAVGNDGPSAPPLYPAAHRHARAY